MSSGEKSSNGYMDVKTLGKGSDFAARQKLEATPATKSVKDNKDNMIRSEDQETMELYARARDQEKELQYLREQIALASIRESELLNEKYALERKFSELRMALDEKQSEVVTSASNELARRKGDLEVNLNLLNELKAVDDEKHIFTTSLIGILAEYGTLPHATNSSALANSIKHLHDQLQLKIRASNARLAEVNAMISNNPRNGFVDKGIANISPMTDQFQNNSMGVHGFSYYSHYADGKGSESADDASRYVQDNDSKHAKGLTRDAEIRQFPNHESILGTLPDIDRNVAGHIGNNMLDRSGFMSASEQRTNQFPHAPVMQDAADSFVSEDDGPGIENFQIIGDAKPGCKLLGCGFPMRGTSLCMFQWVRHYPDGTRQYIEGATNPDYLVTADDVDKLVAVECIPMDEQGRQGDLVRIFANENNKITCDDDMQDDIDAYVSKGSATFPILILLDSSENWEPATLSLRRPGFQVKVQSKQDVVISEKYSKDLLIKIPSGLSAQFVLTCANGSSYPFSTNNDVRMRDMIVLTLRIFQSKAFDEKRKGKA
ncbi:uncharacterized protein LOC127263067 [Andrographis paniculata]|uniref:uncharacterized protein LOC127263067 n=1 Tax=Andrographis paniculata TaxID=175694 RepID=UPI0021E85430|nr:uncharacterized protein LOC127263067 [Andrographis paniculata]